MEAAGESPTYAMLCRELAEDSELLALIGALPEAKQQPNLVLAAARWHAVPVTDYESFRAGLVMGWPVIRETVLARATQTNEPGRCATLLPLLAGLPEPLALIELGASGGLCLYPDRYAYRYGDASVGSGPVVISCRPSGPVPVPHRRPEVVWRAGIDLAPIDVRRPADVRWLECLVWPEQAERLARLRAAVEIARAEPPELVAGDLNERLEEVLGRVPAGATPVVFHSAVLAYLSDAERDRVVARIAELDVHWISNEGPGVLPAVAATVPVPMPADRAQFVLAHNGQAVALAGPHGQSLDWF
jgi:hypothetical protein